MKVIPEKRRAIHLLVCKYLDYERRSTWCLRLFKITCRPH